MKKNIIEALDFLPEHRRQTKRGMSITLDQYIEEARQQKDIKANILDLIMMSYRYYHVFQFYWGKFKKQKKTKPREMEDLLLLAFAALLSRKKEKESLIIFNSVEVAKARFGKFSGSLVNAFLRKTQREKTKIQNEISENPKIILGNYLFRRWEKKILYSQLNQYAQSILLRPGKGIEAFDQEAKWKKYSVEEFFESETLKQAMHLSSWDYISQLHQKVISVKESSVNLLDACAAPGGKLIALNVLDSNKSPIQYFATEAKYPRLELLSENLKRWKLDNKINLQLHAWGNGEKSPFPNQKFEVIVADLPCSGLGTIANRPDLLLINKNYDWTQLFKLQRNILEDLNKQLTKKASFFVSICSIDPDEIEQISNILKKDAQKAMSKALNAYSEYLTYWQ